MVYLQVEVDDQVEGSLFRTKPQVAQ